MSELISGEEALIALANGEGVLYINQECIALNIGEWEDAKELTVFQILSGFWALRLKPRTITLNGIEVPACGENYQAGTYMFVLNSLEVDEYSKVILDANDEVPAYWWRTESEIKQVVAALRSVFKA